MNNPRALLGFGVSATSLSMIFAAWLYIDSYFAKHSDLVWVYTSIEQSHIELRIAWYNFRIDQERRRKEPDELNIAGWENQIALLEIRYRTMSNRQFVRQ